VPAARSIQSNQVIAAHQLCGIFKFIDGIGTPDFTGDRVFEGHRDSLAGAQTNQFLRSELRAPSLARNVSRNSEENHKEE
jgi:hypothetical protein